MARPLPRQSLGCWDAIPSNTEEGKLCVHACACACVCLLCVCVPTEAEQDVEFPEIRGGCEPSHGGTEN